MSATLQFRKKCCPCLLSDGLGTQDVLGLLKAAFSLPGGHKESTESKEKGDSLNEIKVLSLEREQDSSGI